MSIDHTSVLCVRECDGCQLVYANTRPSDASVCLAYKPGRKRDNGCMMV